VLLPAAKYAYGVLGKRKFFLVGSDYVYPRVANAILADELRKLQAEVIDGGYVALGSGDVSKVVAKVRQTQPDVILSTVVGDSNRSFFRALRAAGVTTERTPVISFGITETELRGLSIKDMAGDYLAWNYFQEVDRPENKEFVRRFRERFGSQRGTCDPMESAYTSVHLWARAVEAAKSFDPKAVREAIRDQTYEAPGGVVRVDAETLYTWNTVRLGRIAPSGRVEVVWGSEKPVRPEPFPPSRTRPEWEAFLDGLHRSWGGRWAAAD
jgi:urea transport system substrate-binding protein